MDHQSKQEYRDDLALRAFNGVLTFLMAWLEYLDGYEMEGQWFPSNGMDKARCLQLLSGLSIEQLRDLLWRGLTLTPDAYLRCDPIELPTGIVYEADARAVVFVEGHRDPVRVLYNLLDDDRLLRLRPGEQELLKAAGYPGTIHGVLAVLWRRIAPAEQAPGA